MEYRDYPNSSNVERIAWYPSVRAFDDPAMAAIWRHELNVLTIRFRSGQTYAYWNVAPQQWEQLRDHEGSIGSLVQQTIVEPARRGEYRIHKLEAETLGARNSDAARQEYEREQADYKEAKARELADQTVEAVPSVQTQPAPRPTPRRLSKPG